MHRHLYLLLVLNHIVYAANSETVEHHFYIAPHRHAQREASENKKFLFVLHSVKTENSNDCQPAFTRSGIWASASSLFTDPAPQQSSKTVCIRARYIILGKVLFNTRQRSGSWSITRNELVGNMDRETLRACLDQAYHKSIAYLFLDEDERNEDDKLFIEQLLNSGIRGDFTNNEYAVSFELATKN